MVYPCYRDRIHVFIYIFVSSRSLRPLFERERSRFRNQYASQADLVAGCARCPRITAMAGKSHSQRIQRDLSIDDYVRSSDLSRLVACASRRTAFVESRNVGGEDSKRSVLNGGRVGARDWSGRTSPGRSAVDQCLSDPACGRRTGGRRRLAGSAAPCCQGPGA